MHAGNSELLALAVCVFVKCVCVCLKRETCNACVFLFEGMQRQGRKRQCLFVMYALLSSP